MDWLLYFFTGPIVIFFLVLTRISGVLMTLPFFGMASVPVRFRAFMALGMTTLVTPIYITTFGNIRPVETMIDLVSLLVNELLIGLSTGLAVLILFGALQVAGQLVSQLSGMALSDSFDPTSGTSSPVYAQLFRMVALSVFMATGGHREVLQSLLDSFAWMPPGSEGFDPKLAAVTITKTLQLSFIVGIRGSAPIIVALLLAILITGLISRTVPQLNIMAIGFSLNSIVALLAVFVCLSTLVWIFQDQMDVGFELIREMYYPQN